MIRWTTARETVMFDRGWTGLLLCCDNHAFIITQFVTMEWDHKYDRCVNFCSILHVNSDWNVRLAESLGAIRTGRMGLYPLPSRFREPLLRPAYVSSLRWQNLLKQSTPGGMGIKINSYGPSIHTPRTCQKSALYQVCHVHEEVRRARALYLR